MADTLRKPTHYLHHNHYSICSIMVRYTYALRGTPNDPDKEIWIEERSVDLGRGDQLTEHYLCNINAAGEVPVLVEVDSDMTMPDSQEITKYIARSYASLIPDSHRDAILSLLAELHGINFFSLTFTGSPEAVEGRKAGLQKKLEGTVSDRYREAIEYKIQRYNTNKIRGLKSEVVEENEEKAKTLMLRFEKMVHDSQTDWLFGSDQASALDSHLIVFIKRMYDVNRRNLIPENLQQYGNRAMTGSAWQDVMEGRATMPP